MTGFDVEVTASQQIVTAGGPEIVLYLTMPGIQGPPGPSGVAAIPDGSIADAKISPTAGIALSKLAANPLARANHTGTQAASTISDLAGAVQTGIDSARPSLAGAGLALNGSALDVVTADSSLVVTADSVTVGLVPVGKGGTGATAPAAARVNLGAVTQYEADAPALTPGVPASVTHNLGSSDVSIYVREKTGGARVHLDETVLDVNTVSLKADIGYSSGQLRVVVRAKA